MFFSALKTFKNKFLNEKIIENSVVGSSINSNSNEQNDEEKKSTDSEYIEDIKLSKLTKYSSKKLIINILMQILPSLNLPNE